MVALSATQFLHQSNQYHHVYSISSLLQDIITHQLKFSELEKGIGLVNNSAESIKVVLIPDS